MSKYGAVRTAGFASKLEHSVYQLLELMVKAKEIHSLTTQTHVYLTDARIDYIADFSAIEVNSGERVYFEAKGVETATWRIKRRLWISYGPGKLTVFKGTYKRPFVYEILEPKCK